MISEGQLVTEETSLVAELFGRANRYRSSHDHSRAQFPNAIFGQSAALPHHLF